MMAPMDGPTFARSDGRSEKHFAARRVVRNVDGRTAIIALPTTPAQRFLTRLRFRMADFYSTVGYHGEPSPEITSMIWRVAEERHPDDPTKQSAFDDGAHFLVQVMRQACAEIVRLHGMLDATGAFTDKAAFGKFNADYTKAYRSANDALTAVLGEAVTGALHFQPVEADATLPYEADEA